MDEIHAGAGAFGHACDVPECQVFHGFRVNQVGVIPVPVVTLLGHEVVVHHEFIVFAVDGQHTSVALYLLHQII